MEPIMITHDGVSIKHISDFVYALNIRNGEVAPQHVINVTSDQQKNCKYFSSREARQCWLIKRNNLIDYVLSFYGEDSIYNRFFGKGISRDEVMFITNAIDKAGIVNGLSGSYHIDWGDTFSREVIRDYMYLCRGEDNVEYELPKIWFERNVVNKIVEHEFLIKK